MGEFTNDEKILKSVATAIRRRLKDAETGGVIDSADKCRVFLFGSRADGTAKSRSDYDIGIDCDGAELPAETLLSIKNDMEKLPTLFRVDVVDFGATGERFRSVASQHIIPL